MKIGFTM